MILLLDIEVCLFYKRTSERETLLLFRRSVLFYNQVQDNVVHKNSVRMRIKNDEIHHAQSEKYHGQNDKDLSGRTVFLFLRSHGSPHLLFFVEPLGANSRILEKETKKRGEFPPFSFF